MLQAVEFDAAARQRIADAAQEELRLRLEGVLDIAADVGPWRLSPLKLRHVAEMQYAQNNLLTGGKVDASDMLQLLWLTAQPKDKAHQRRFFKRSGKRLRQKAVWDELYAYFVAQLNEIPDRGGSKGGHNNKSFLVPVVDTIAESYGWTRQDIMEMSISFAFQLYQEIEYRKSGRKIRPSNPITSRAQAIEFNRMQSASQKEDNTDG